MRRLPRLPIRTLAAASLAFVGVTALPGIITASCGDYVHVQTHDEAPIAPQPCHGPECSRVPASAALPLTAPVPSSESDDPTVIINADADHRPSPGWAAGVATDAHPVRVTSSTFHPPRAN
jgi:hypothetical protein